MNLRRVGTNNKLTSVVLVSLLVIGGFVGFLYFESENAQGTDVSGPIGTDTIWDLGGSPYIVIGDVTVLSGITLTIEPGVEVRFDGFYGITVNGTLIAIGTETDRINITSNNITPSPGNWFRIQINSNGHAEIKYCNLTYSFFGIYLSGSSYNNITNNNISYNQEGIHSSSSSYNNITDNYFSNNGEGIYLVSSSNNNISNNNMSLDFICSTHLTSSSNNNITNNNISSNFDSGIYLDFSSDSNNITNNNISQHGNYGLYLDSSSDNIITNNIISNNNDGIHIEDSSNNIILNNNISWNTRNGIHMSQVSNSIIANNNFSTNGDYYYMGYGIEIRVSTNLTILNNNFINDGIQLYGNPLSNFNTHTITVNNLVNGKPLYYYKDTNGLNIDGIPVGQLILANCSNVDVRNLHITNTETGITLGHCTDIQINHNSLSSNKGDGIHLYHTSNSNITNNNISFIRMGGIYLDWSQDNQIISNYVSYSGRGIGLTSSSSDRNIVKNNVVSSNSGAGIFLQARYCNITANTISHNEEGIWIHAHSDSNVNNNNISDNLIGILFTYSRNNNIANNDISFNEVAISLPHALDTYGNTIIYNQIADNDIGFNIDASLDNMIHHNNIVNNIIQAVDNTTDGNHWDDGYPSGGNYWSDFDEPGDNAYDDYKGPDQDILGSDGIVDNGTIGGGGRNPYVIDKDSQDNYPLINLTQWLILYEGWNLISIPRIQIDTNPGTILSSISGAYSTIQWYNSSDTKDPWKHNCTTKPQYLNDFDSIDHLIGFWIYITEPGGVNLEYSGPLPGVPENIPLHTGWNMVGFPSLSNKDRTTALNNLDFGVEVDAIWTFEGATQTWEAVGPGDDFKLGKGYWVHATQECVWEVPL